MRSFSSSGSITSATTSSASRTPAAPPGACRTSISTASLADFYKHYAQRMSTTTSTQVQELAQKYLHPEKVSIVVVGEAKQIRPELEKFGKVFVYDTDLKLVPDKLPPAPAAP